MRRFICVLSAVVSFLFGGREVCAQITEYLYTSDCRIDTLRQGQLSFEADNLSFFKNNEFNSTVQKGYTLPGFWSHMKISYYPCTNLKLETGVHSIWFWGTTRYPAFAYQGISNWRGREDAYYVHVLPYFRAHVALSDHVDIILGNIYGGSNHRLIEPLYNPELNLTSDPESGMQLLYNTKWLHLDMWVNWMTYIYKLDTKSEVFVAGTTARINANREDAPLHVYFRLQWLAQHQGGEIDVTNENVQTIMNSAAGVGFKRNINRKVLKYINAEFDVTNYNYPKGRVSVPGKGHGFYAGLAVQLRDFHVRTSYWRCKDFVTILGNPFYGSVSLKEEDMLYKKPEMFHAGVDYLYPVNIEKGFYLGIMAEVYYYLSGMMYSSETGLPASAPFGRNTNFSLGVCLRINPSFLLKQY
ncbi:MAG: hypothetical protein LBG28_02135 [Tannerella sp.]|nr:hypothetical protein [Tannerella sp.]